MTPSEREARRRAVQLASAVKHDINNLLMGVLGQTEILRLDPGLPERTRARLDAVAEQGRKIRDRVADLDEIRALLAESD
jgi:signal transduction histidine kinase